MIQHLYPRRLDCENDNRTRQFNHTNLVNSNFPGYFKKKEKKEKRNKTKKKKPRKEQTIQETTYHDAGYRLQNISCVSL